MDMWMHSGGWDSPALGNPCVNSVCFVKLVRSGGLALPTVIEARMLHPGQKRHANSAGKRVMQEVNISADYPAMPEGCDQYRRLGRVEVQKQVKKGQNENDHKRDGWATLQFKGWIYSRSKEGIGGISSTPVGHEGPWYYWKPGQKVKAKFDNVVRYLPSGQTYRSKVKTIRVEVVTDEQAAASASSKKNYLPW